MRFKLDENLPVEAAEIFRKAGHDAYTVLEQSMGGNPDDDLAAVCVEEERILITLDTDFADIRAYPPECYLGIIILRLERQDRGSVLSVLTRLLPLLNLHPLEKQLRIVNEDRLRIRGAES